LLIHAGAAHEYEGEGEVAEVAETPDGSGPARKKRHRGKKVDEGDWRVT